MNSDVRAWLLERGAEPWEIDRAGAEGTLHVLVAERIVVPDDARYTPRQIAAATGSSLEFDRRLWRALGFAAVDDDEPAFAESDAQALRQLQNLLALGLADRESLVQLTRVIGSSMARIAEAEVEASPALRGDASSELLAELYITGAGDIFGAISGLMDYAWRRHLKAAMRQGALRRSRTSETGAVDMAVGFADLVGFTALSQQLSEGALGAVVARFEELAYETVAQLSGRVVKMIGDEVMFSCNAAVDAAEIALALSSVYADDDMLSDVRVGLAAGPVLLRDGDCYGATVNRASRIVGIAAPGTVLADREVHDRLRGDERYRWRTLRPRYLKDIGRVPLWALAAATDGRRRPRRPLVSEAIRQRVEQAHALGRDVLDGGAG